MVVGLFHSGAGGDDHGDQKPNDRLSQASLPPREAPPLPLPGGREERTAWAAQGHTRKTTTTTSSQAKSLLRSMTAVIVILPACRLRLMNTSDWKFGTGDNN